jgi:hypothetical protein
VPDEEVPSTDAIRFTYELDGSGALALVDASTTSMTTFSGDDLDPDLAPYGGFWWELRDADGTALWRQVTSHPLSDTVETTGGGTLGRLDNEFSSPAVTVAVPGLEGAATVAVMGAPPDQLDGEVVELLTHDYEAFVQ